MGNIQVVVFVKYFRIENVYVVSFLKFMKLYYIFGGKYRITDFIFFIGSNKRCIIMILLFYFVF